MDVKSGVSQIMVAKVNVTRQERRSTLADACGARLGEVGDAAMAGERRWWKIAGKVEYACVRTVENMRRKSGVGR